MKMLCMMTNEVYSEQQPCKAQVLHHRLTLGWNQMICILVCLIKMEQCTEEEMLIPETELLQLDAYQLT